MISPLFCPLALSLARTQILAEFMRPILKIRFYSPYIYFWHAQMFNRASNCYICAQRNIRAAARIKNLLTTARKIVVFFKISAKTKFLLFDPSLLHFWFYDHCTTLRMVRESLVAAGEAFLLSPTVTPHSDDSKRKFLQTKGLTKDEITAAFAKSRSCKSTKNGPTHCQIMDRYKCIM